MQQKGLPKCFGSEFHVIGPMTARRLYVIRRCDRTVNWWLVAKRKYCRDAVRSTRAPQYLRAHCPEIANIPRSANSVPSVTEVQLQYRRLLDCYIAASLYTVCTWHVWERPASEVRCTITASGHAQTFKVSLTTRVQHPLQVVDFGAPARKT